MHTIKLLLFFPTNHFRSLKRLVWEMYPDNESRVPWQTDITQYVGEIIDEIIESMCQEPGPMAARHYRMTSGHDQD
jgi:hypothetical protein